MRKGAQAVQRLTLAFALGVGLTHGAQAQDVGQDVAQDVAPATEPAAQVDPAANAAAPSDAPVGVTVLGAPGTPAPEETKLAPEATADAAANQAAPDDIGLIEAPEGAPGIAAESLPFGTDSLDDSAPIASFAERRSAQAKTRMFGPIGHPPVVVELFTSQGCSSCPPADEILGDLAQRDDILALSWHVDYWDYLGWADEFARPEFTVRQQDYAHASGERAIYTPQMIVGGTDTLIAARPAELMAMIDLQMARPAPVLVTSGPQKGGGYQIELTPRAALRHPVAILLVRYAPERRVTIKAGENRGIVVTYRNVVLASEQIGGWDGRAPLRMNVRADLTPADAFPDDTRHAILAQQVGRDHDVTGPILAAIRLD